MADPISNVTIVGGGTAGWLTAMLLNAMFSDESGQARVAITVIESPNIPTVGVGEATVPGMPRVLKTCGVSERDFFKTCNASFKLGVMFQKWNVDRTGAFIDYVNPFGRPGFLGGLDLAYSYMQQGADGLDFVQTYAPALDLIRAGKGPRPLGQPDFSGEAGYAYHLDAGRFAGLMRDISIKRGVVHVLDDVVDVTRDAETGNIATLVLQDRGAHPVELVIDCTGFRGLLINKVLEEPFISYANYLANDRALAVQIPYTGEVRVDCATRSTALGAGWSWRVPLFNRVGTGYVFSSAHRTDDAAMAEFLDHLGPEAEGLEPRVIPMRVGRSRNLWVKNCVAIGLSGGFIEPLESTAIHMIDTSIRWLFTHFPDKDFAPPLRDNYNRLTGQLYDEVRDFICLHYALGNRSDSPYWIDARTELEVPDSLAANLELWRHVLPGPYDLQFQTLFPYTVYQAVMLGKGVYDTDYAAGTVGRQFATRPRLWREYLTRTRGAIDAMVAKAADHTTLLRELRGEPLQPSHAASPSVFAGFGGAAPTIPVPGAGLGSKLNVPGLEPAKEDKPSEEASLL